MEDPFSKVWSHIQYVLFPIRVAIAALKHSFKVCMRECVCVRVGHRPGNQKVPGLISVFP